MDADDFLQKDYELKVKYLCDHFSRMWTRFNFFLSIESGLLAFSCSKESAAYAGYLALVGFALSFLWYRFSATDNFLVEVYRRQIAHVFHLLKASREQAFKAAGLDPTPSGYTYVGEISSKAFDPASGTIKPVEQNIWQNRSPRVSATELGVVFSLLFALLWMGRIIVWCRETGGQL